MSYTPAKCGNGLEQWIGQGGRATYTGQLEPVKDKQGKAHSTHVTVDIDADGITLTRGRSSEGPASYRFHPETSSIRWGSEGAFRELAKPVCDGDGTVLSADMTTNEAADGTKMQGKVSRDGAGSAAG
jgi:hypothetical protein